MKNFVTVAAFAAGANALVGRSSSCCFHINVSGGSQGELGQLGDGQNRVGDNSLSPAQYCIDTSGGITDANGRGCILTPPTTQFQCDEGAKPTNGFSVNEQGQIEYNGSTQFYACETGQNDGLNIYTSTDENQTGCRPVNMAADSCSGSGSGNGGSSPSSSSPAGGASPSPRPSEGSGSGSGSSSVPSAPSSGSGSSPSGPAGGSSPSGPAGGSSPSGSGSSVTVWTTRTTSICDSTSAVPTAPVQTPSGPAGGSSPSGPAGGSSPSGPAGGSSPSGPAGGSSPSGPAGGSQPSQSVPIQTPSGPAGGSQPQPSQSAPGGGSGSTPSQPAPQPSSSSPSGGNNGGNGGSGNGNSCPTNLNGEYQAPHLIVPVDSSKPDSAPGTSYNGTISESKTTLYNFDIPQSYESKTCSLVFLFPKQEDLETSAFTFSGDGKIDFAKLQSTVQESTSYSNMPSVEQDYGVTTVSPGNSYTISTFDCPAGQSVAYEMKNAGSTYLDFFEDYNPSPLGLYITTC